MLQIRSGGNIKPCDRRRMKFKRSPRRPGGGGACL